MTKITSAAHTMLIIPQSADDVYGWLKLVSLGLCLDVGAAAGWMTKEILKASPTSSVVAFEPFPGNHQFIEADWGHDARVRIVKKAVSNFIGQSKFYVACTVTNGSGIWARMNGYSSVGMIIPESDARAKAALTVETCRLDDEIFEPVRFMKIDVQGGEFDVLDGARQLFDQHGVEFILVEYQGDERVVSFLADRGYAIVDTKYFSTPVVEPLDPDDWHIIDTMKLSTGHSTSVAEPLRAPEGPKAYCDWFSAEHRRYKAIWTDLVAVAPWSQLLKK